VVERASGSNPKMNAIFLDRDGTIIKDKNYSFDPNTIEFEDGALEGLRSLATKFELFIITNQSGVGRGLFTLEDVDAFHRVLAEKLKAADISLKQILVCPHRPEENCECRKPKTSLLSSLKQIVNKRNSWVIGDKPADVYLAKNFGCESVFVMTGAPLNSFDELKELPFAIAVANIKFAAAYILSDQSKLIARNNIANIAKKMKEQGQRIVTLNGSFDIIHEGHLWILEEAKRQGDILIMGVNSDQSVRVNKGPTRPINSQEARARLLAGCKFVDYVFIFDEQNPIPFLKEIRPAVHVNGSDYGENCLEAPTVKELGGRLEIVRLKEGLSTSNLLAQKTNGNL
jgi:rfaE bifunctional protein nucleotidyltransferase chain/domain